MESWEILTVVEKDNTNELLGGSNPAAVKIGGVVTLQTVNLRAKEGRS